MRLQEKYPHLHDPLSTRFFSSRLELEAIQAEAKLHAQLRKMIHAMNRGGTPYDSIRERFGGALGEEILPRPKAYIPSMNRSKAVAMCAAVRMMGTGKE